MVMGDQCLMAHTDTGLLNNNRHADNDTTDIYYYSLLAVMKWVVWKGQHLIEKIVSLQEVFGV